MKRSGFLRRARKPSRRREPRPGVTPQMPPGWRQLCGEIARRDGDRCRRDGHVIEGQAHINHVIARRIAPELIADPVNLCTLCPACHGWVTSRLEPALFRGDVQAFQRFLDVLALSGPVPDEAMRALAYQRIRELREEP